MKIARFVALPALLAGCASPYPMGASPADARVVAWEKLCAERGLARNTLDFAVCVDGYAAAADRPPPAPIPGD